jgi:hypothetical protein
MADRVWLAEHKPKYQIGEWPSGLFKEEVRKEMHHEED